MTDVAAEAVVVSKSSVASSDPSKIVGSNIDFVNALLEECLELPEVSPDALRSYYADYYVAQMNNGGFSQFVYNSRWDEDVIRLVREGLAAIGAHRQLSLFERGEQLVAGLGVRRLRRFIKSEYFGENKERDELNRIDEEFQSISEMEEIVALNSAWLRQLPNLVVLDDQQIAALAKRRGRELPDQQDRIAKAREGEPTYMKAIRSLCEKAGHELDRVTAGDPTRVWRGRRMLAWHFLTDHGHYHMIDADGACIMFRGHSDEEVCRIDSARRRGSFRWLFQMLDRLRGG